MPPACAALAGALAGFTSSTISAGHARQALFRSTLDGVLLLIREPQGNVGNVEAVALPGGYPYSFDEWGPWNYSSIEWLDPGQSAILGRRPAEDTAYDLMAAKGIQQTDGLGMTVAVAANVCGHRIGAGGRVYAVHYCKAGTGILKRIDVDISDGMSVDGPFWVADLVRSDGIAISPDGKWAAFASNVTTTRGCGHPHGVLKTVSSSTLTGAAEVLAHSLQVLPGSRYVIYLRRTGPICDDAGLSLERADLEAPSATLPLGTDLAFPLSSALTPYQVSPDGKLLLAPRLDHASAKAQLLAIDTTGPGKPPVLLASDLHPPGMFALSASGKHAFYVSAGPGLSVVPSGGGKPSPIASKIFWDFKTHSPGPGAFVVSETTDAVAYLEEAGPENRLWVASGSGATDLRHSTSATVSSVRFVPDGRGLLLVENTPSGSTLRYVSATGPIKTSVLGRWTTNHLGPLPYHVDPSGCAVVFDSDLEGGRTFLALIPR